MKLPENYIQNIHNCLNSGELRKATNYFCDLALASRTPHLMKVTKQLILANENHLINKDEPKTQEILQKLIDFEYPDTHVPELTLSVKNLSKSYSNSGFSLRSVNIELKNGEILGLVGENGNGKTTLLRILAGDLNFDEGNLEYHTTHYPIHSYNFRSELVYIPQRIPTWYGSLLDNLYFNLSAYTNDPERIKSTVDLWLIRFGVYKFKYYKWSDISSGYKTRFELIRNLIRSPKLMLLDEPLSNLDINSQQTLLNDLKEISHLPLRPFSIVMSSQQLYEVEKTAEKVIFLQQGKPIIDSLVEEEQKQELIFEMDSAETKERLSSVLQPKEILINGGTYILKFEANTSDSFIYRAIADHELKITYIRNISQSSRRFFIQA